MTIILTRYWSKPVQTLGKLVWADGSLHTLELPWLDNAKNISCIPVGLYRVRKRWSEKYGHHFHILDVPGRKWILIHSGNFYNDIRGCVLVGTGLADINGDGVLDVTHSRAAMNRLLKAMPDEF